MNSSQGVSRRAAAVLLALVALLGLASVPTAAQEAAPSVSASAPVDAATLRLFESLPIQDGGRVKPLRSFADVHLLRFSGQRRLTLADGTTLSGPSWLLRTLLRPELAVDDALFLVPDDAVIRAAGLDVGAHRKRDRYSFRELEPGLPKLFELAHEAAQLDEKQRSSVQAQTVTLAGNVNAFLGLVQPLEASGALAVLPPAVDVAAEPEWLTPAQLEQRGRAGLSVDPEHARLMTHWQQLKRRRDDPRALHDTLADFGAGTRALMTARGEGARLDLELSYHRWGLLRWALAAFLLGFVAVAWSWLRPGSRWAPRLGLGASAAGALAVSVVIVLRCLIRGRPPVSTLYETVLFVTATGCLLALAMEWINRRRVGLAAAAVLGTLGVFLANGYELLDKQDTMPSLVAVLDTNFWLATHVTAITLGYSAGLLAALLGNGLLLARLFRVRRADAAWERSMSGMIYGVLAFAALFATVGTILGGIWANESWGRFWGWDPKENGALLIVITQVAILHARKAGRLRAFGTAWAAAFGGTVIAFSWWGVNLLGVGLHSYGFTSGIHSALWTYYLAQWAVCAAALLDRRSARLGAAAHD